MSLTVSPFRPERDIPLQPGERTILTGARRRLDRQPDTAALLLQVITEQIELIRALPAERHPALEWRLLGLLYEHGEQIWTAVARRRPGWQLHATDEAFGSRRCGLVREGRQCGRLAGWWEEYGVSRVTTNWCCSRCVLERIVGELRHW